MDESFTTRLVEAATDVVNKHGAEQYHTVGAAVATKDNEIISGVNVFHFTGGPCAEIVAMGNAISKGEKELIAVVAVGDRDRGVLAPCGRCRQVLFDYYPDMQVIVMHDGRYITKPIRDMLPDIYNWKEQQTKNIAE